MLNSYSGDTKKYRLAALAVLLVVLFAASCIRLMKMQIVDGAGYLETANTKVVSTTTVQAARGDIVDRYGRILATSETGFHVVFDYAFIDRKNLNRTVRELLGIFVDSGEDWNNHTPLDWKAGGPVFPDGRDSEIDRMRETLDLDADSSPDDCLKALYDRYGINTESYFGGYPITLNGDGEYEFEKEKNSKIKALKEQLGLSDDASAENCVERMLKNSAEFDLYTGEDAFRVACVRYSMLRKEFSIDNKYTFAEDITADTVIKIKEQSYLLAGVDISEIPTRVYQNGDVATHLIGTVGPIYAEEYEEYKAKGYAMNDIIGKSGIESALEEELQGNNGKIKVTQNGNGDIIGTETAQAAVTGKTVRLTIDSLFQQRLQELLAGFVGNAKSGSYRSKGGAIVVLDVKTGEVLAAVNSANYTVDEYKSNYSGLLNEDTNPLFNRAVDGIYRPGSSLKPVVSAAALAEGEIGTKDRLYCSSPYKHGFRCLQENHSGNINVTQALHWSCNTFYYRLGESMGIETLQKYAAYFGLGEDTGLEIKHAKGRFAGPATTEKLGGTWNAAGDVMQAAIGQNETAVSPLQMAIEAMTLANRGVRYETHLVSAVIDPEGNEAVTSPVVASSFEMSDADYNAISEGMRLASTKVPAPYQLTNLGYGVAQKTGTAQTSSATRFNNDFIGFLPIEDPEIAISCIVEDCASGTSWMMREIIELYYECKAIGEEQSNSQY